MRQLLWLKRFLAGKTTHRRLSSTKRPRLEVLEDRCLLSAPGFLDPTFFPSLGTLHLTSGTYTLKTTGATPELIDSGGHVLFTGTTIKQGSSFDPTVAVFDFNSINVGQNVTINAVDAAHSLPVAFLSRGSAVIDGIINVDGQNGHNGVSHGAGGAGGLAGPGGGAGGKGGNYDPSLPGWGTNGTNGQGPGMGAGGYSGLGDQYSEGGGAGHGGQGYDAEGLPYGATYDGFAGGSGAGGSGGNLFGGGGGGGGGGGALAIVASGTITLDGAIRANGGNGGSNPITYGGSGGSGGEVVLAAPTIDLSWTSDVTADGDTLAIEVKAGSGTQYSGGGIVQFYSSNGYINVYNPYSQHYVPTNDPNLAQVSAAGTVYGQPGVVDFGNVSGLKRTNVSSDVSVTLGRLSYNSTTQEYVQNVTVKNTSSNTLVGPLALQLTNLSSNATLANASGTIAGDPAIAFASSSGQLAHNQSITLTLYFRDPTNQPITYGTQVWLNV